MSRVVSPGLFFQRSGVWGGAPVTPAPTVTSFTPTTVGAGTSVVLTGTNFTGATSVKFNGVDASIFNVDSPTQITATVPATASGTITVTTAGGATTSSAYVFALSSDSFTDADGTLWTAHQPDVGPKPTNLAGSFKIAGNKLTTNVTGSHCKSVMDSGQTDCKITVTVTPGDSNNRAGVIGRASDSTHLWFGYFDVNSSLIAILDGAAGSHDTHAFAYAAGKSYKLTAWIFGTTFTFQVVQADDATKAQGCTTTMATELTNTKVGLEMFDANGVFGTFDDFLAVPYAVTPAPLADRNGNGIIDRNGNNILSRNAA